MILEHAGDYLPVITFDGEEELFFNFLAYKGWEPSWSSNYLVSITSPEPFDDFPSFLIEWGKYRQAELELLC